MSVPLWQNAAIGGAAGSPALALLFVVAAQFAVQPMLTKRCVEHGTATSSLVFGAELVKIAGCAVMLSRSGGAAGRKAFRGWTLKGCLLAAGVPSVTYLVQSYCIQVSYQRLDPVVFNVLNQTKAIFTALFSWLIVGRPQSFFQCVALCLVTFGGVLVSVASSASSQGAAVQGREGNSTLGVTCLIFAAMLSGLGSGITEWSLQRNKRDNFLLTMEMAVLGCLVLSVSLLLNLTADSQLLWSEGLFARWTWRTFLPVTTQGLSGIVVGLVTKIAGGVKKVLATIAGLILTCVLQLIVSGERPSVAVCFAVPVVALGIYLHASFPPKLRRKDVAMLWGEASMV